MAHVADHLSVAALEERYEACADATSSRHFQTIWLLAKGHTIGEVSAMTSFGRRWIEQLLERYNAFGPSALGDLRRRNGAAATVLRPIDWSIQKPRPRNPKAATPAEQDARPVCKEVLSRSAADQSASTYPASKVLPPGQDGDTRVPVLIKVSASSAVF